MYLLIICHEYPRPDVAASNRRLVDMLQLISKRHRVDLFCPGSTYHLVEPRYETLYRSMGVQVVFGDGATLKRQLLSRFYDICLFEWWVTVPTAIDEVRRLQPWAIAIVDAVDVCFRREEAALAIGHLKAEDVAENRRREIEAYSKAEALLSVSSEDRATLQECSLKAPIFFIPMIETIRHRSRRPRAREILFVGTFGINPANVDAVLWFVREVWPSVHASVPEARLTLVGSNVTPEIERLAEIPGIEVVGFVADLEPYLDRVAVSIAPLRFGGGMKGKVTEAMSRGIPLVTTRFGVQGLEVTSGEHLIVADDAQAFAHGVIMLLQDEEKAERIGLAGQEFIAGLCSPEVVEREVEAILTWAASHQRPRTWSSSLGWGAKSAVNHSTNLVTRPAETLKSLAKRMIPPAMWDALKRVKNSKLGDKTSQDMNVSG